MTETAYSTVIGFGLAFVNIFDAFGATAIISIVADTIETADSVKTSGIWITVVNFLSTLINLGTVASVASVSNVAVAIIASLSVGADGVNVTIVSFTCTFVDIIAS